MRSFITGTAIIGCIVLTLVFITPPASYGDEWNLTTRFTVSRDFEIPGMVLQANTPYVIRLFDSPSTRTIVQLFNEDQTHMLTTFMAIPDERLEATDNTQFTFIETQPGFPLPVKEWFYPGRLSGVEFVYPKDQATQIAHHALEPILAADTNDLRHLSTVKVESIGPVGKAPVTESATNITKSESTSITEEKPSIAETTPIEPAAEPVPEPESEAQAVEPQPTDNVEQIAQNTEPAVQQEQPAEPAAVTEENRETELPRTAGELPLIALIGALCLGAGLGLRVLSAKS